MGLKIINVVNGNTPSKEYVILKTDEAINIKGYAVVDRTFNTDGELSNEFRHIFVFPNLKIQENDWVCLYSSKGEYKKVKNKGDTYTHHLFWGSDHCIWNNNGEDIASLIKYTLINSERVPKLDNP